MVNTVITNWSHPSELCRPRCPGAPAPAPAGPPCGGSPQSHVPQELLQGPGMMASLGDSAQYDPRPFLGLVQGSAHPWEGAAGRLNRGRSEAGLGSAASEAP